MSLLISWHGSLVIQVSWLHYGLKTTDIWTVFKKGPRRTKQLSNRFGCNGFPDQVWLSQQYLLSVVLQSSYIMVRVHKTWLIYTSIQTHSHSGATLRAIYRVSCLVYCNRDMCWGLCLAERLFSMEVDHMHCVWRYVKRSTTDLPPSSIERFWPP